MNGITINQYVDQLKIWNAEIEKKQKFLARGFKVYQLIYFFSVSISNVSNFIAAFLSSIIIGYSTQNGNDEIITILSSISATFSIIAIICSAIDIVFKPQSTAEQSSFSSKCYEDLYREISVEILTVGNTNAIDADEFDNEFSVSFEKYKSKLLYYSSREQIISVNEPGLTLIGYKRRKLTATNLNELTNDDISLLNNCISGIEDDSQKKRAEQIFSTVLKNSSPRKKISNITSDSLESSL